MAWWRKDVLQWDPFDVEYKINKVRQACLTVPNAPLGSTRGQEKSGSFPHHSQYAEDTVGSVVVFLVFPFIHQQTEKSS
jgi:hypothetical protein